MASPVAQETPDPEGAPDAKRAKTESAPAPEDAPASLPRPPSPTPSSASGVRYTYEGWHIPIGKDEDGNVTWALILKDTAHLDEMYEVQLEEAVHGRSGTLKVWSKDVREMRNFAWEEETKLWDERAKYFADYVKPGAKVLTLIGQQAMREELRMLPGGSDLLNPDRKLSVSGAWSTILNLRHTDEDAALRAAVVFDTRLAELEADYENYFYPNW